MIAGDERKVDVRTVLARLFSVDEVLRSSGKASVHAVLMVLSFRKTWPAWWAAKLPDKKIALIEREGMYKWSALHWGRCVGDADR